MEIFRYYKLEAMKNRKIVRNIPGEILTRLRADFSLRFDRKMINKIANRVYFKEVQTTSQAEQPQGHSSIKMLNTVNYTELYYISSNYLLGEGFLLVSHQPP